MSSRISALLTAISWLSIAPFAVAHGDLHEQIQAVSQSIKADPTNATLYHKRGELHRAHAEYLEAMIDYAQAEKLDPTMEVVFLSRGRALFESGKFPLALEPLNTFLSRQPDHMQARWLRAQVLVNTGRHADAELDFKQGLDAATDPTPDQFIERANNLRTIKRDREALAVLGDGIKRLGPLITLELAALDLEVALKENQAAVKRIDALLEKAERKETFWMRKGEVLESMGGKAQARSCYTRVIETIAALPERQRKVKAVRKLEDEARQRLSAISAAPVSASQ